MSLRRTTLDRAIGRHREVIEFGLVYVVLALFPLVEVIVPSFAFRVKRMAPDALPGRILLDESWFWVILAMVVVAVGYALLRDLPNRVDIPARADLDTVAVAVVGPLFVAAGLLLTLQLLGSSVTAVASMAGFSNPTPRLLWWNTVVPGALVGVGYGVLFYGAIIEGLRTTLDVRNVLPTIAALAGLYHWFVDPIWQFTRSNVLLLVALIFVVGTAIAIVELSRVESNASIQDVLTPIRVGAIVLAAVLSFVVIINVLSGATTAAELLFAGCWFVVFGLGTWALDRSDSIWLPSLTIASFQIAILATPSLELILGLVGAGT